MAPSPPDGSRPGAQFISYDEATRFDERIVEKSRNHNDLTASASGGKKQQCGKVADGDKVVASRSSAPSKAKKSFNSRIDEDIQTKQRVKSSSSAFTRVTPGAQAVRDTPAVQRRTSSSLETLDRDIEAKNRARRSYATSGSAPQKKVAAAPSFYSLGSTATSEASATNSKSNDDDVAAKNRARSSGPSMIPGAFVATSETKPTPVSSAASYASLPASEMEVATAKNRARSSTGPAMIPGAYEAKNDNSSNMVHKDIVFGGRDYGSTRKIPSGGLDDVDMLAKQSAAPLSIGIDEGYGEQLFQKKMNAAYAGIGAEASHGGCPEKKGDGGPSRMAVQMATNNEATFINHKLGRTLGGMHGLGQMQLTIDDVEFHDLEDNKLAVATAIVEEEEDAFIPAAIEYDPDAKPPLYRNRRFRLYGFLAVVLMIFVTVVAIVIPTQVTNTDDDFGPTMAPTTFRESLGIQEQIEKYVGNAKLYDSNTSHSKALEWLLHEDPAQLSPDAENLLQRFILAVFYFHTSEQHPWLSCNPPAANETADCQYKNLAQIWPTFTYEDVPWRRWLSEKHECLWAGVFCERNKTTGIDIKGQGLSGHFPTELSQLPFLRSLRLAFNELSGSIPTSLASTMKHMNNIELHYNKITGTLPEEMFYFENLIRFNLGGNRLTGSLAIPEDAKLENLKGIFLFENELTGTIPTDFFMFDTLSYIRLQKNNITGTIPSEVGLLSNLQEFWVHQTDMSGEIPTGIGSLSKLKDLRVFGTHMSGTLPDELYTLRQIDRLDLYDSNFSGTISTKIGQLSTLDIFRISGNKFSGTLPTELGQLTQLQQAWFKYNRFEGMVPSGLCELREEKTLVQLSADCKATQDNGTALVDCPSGCCTVCCETETQTCLSVHDG